MADTTTTTTDADVHTELHTLLGVCLPGLSDDDLRDLCARVADELELRVGSELSRGLSDAQLSEFDDLAGRDDASAYQWLHTVRPDYRVVVAEVRADLVAETVRTVAGAQPAAAAGRRVVSPLLPTSLDLVEEHLRARGVKYSRTDRGMLRVAFAAEHDTPAAVIYIELAGGDHDILALTGRAHTADFPAEEGEQVFSFAADWNRRTWNPKAVVFCDEDTGRCRITGEVAVHTGRMATRSQIGIVVDRGIGSILGFFGEVGHALPAPVTASGDSDTLCATEPGTTPPPETAGVQ